MENIDRLFAEDQLFTESAHADPVDSPPHKTSPVLIISPDMSPILDPFSLPQEFPCALSPSVPTESLWSAAELPSQTLQAPQKRPAPKRGRKPMFANLPEPQRRAMAKIVRATKNRRCARESREKKQRYVIGLEEEVGSLRAELAEYKKKFAKYETIDRQLDSEDAEDQRVVESAINEMKQTNATSRQFPDIFMRKMEEKLEERRKALEQLARMTVEIAVPLTLRGFLRCADHCPTMCPPKLEEMFGRVPDPEDAKNIQAVLQIRPPTLKEIACVRELATKAKQRLKENVKRMLKCQRKIQFETWRVWKAITDDYMPKYQPGKVESSVIYHQKLRGRPELSDYTLFGVADNDFAFDTAAAARDRFCKFGNCVESDHDDNEDNNANGGIKSY